MTSFIHRIGDDAVDSGKKGWLVAILELGAWFGVLCTGYLADKLSRKFAILNAVVIFVRDLLCLWLSLHRANHSLVYWSHCTSYRLSR